MMRGFLCFLVALSWFSCSSGAELFQRIASNPSDWSDPLRFAAAAVRDAADLAKHAKYPSECDEAWAVAKLVVVLTGENNINSSPLDDDTLREIRVNAMYVSMTCRRDIPKEVLHTWEADFAESELLYAFLQNLGKLQLNSGDFGAYYETYARARDIHRPVAEMQNFLLGFTVAAVKHGKIQAGIEEAVDCLRVDPTTTIANQCAAWIIYLVGVSNCEDLSKDISLSDLRQLWYVDGNRSNGSHPFVELMLALWLWVEHPGIDNAKKISQLRQIASRLALVKDMSGPSWNTELLRVLSLAQSLGPFEMQLEDKCNLVESGRDVWWRPQSRLLSNVSQAHLAGSNRWIVKHCRGAQSQGTRILSSDELMQQKDILMASGAWLVEQYMSNPMTVQGRKFDLKGYVLVASSPILDLHRAYLYTDGRFYVASTPWKMADWDDIDIHRPTHILHLRRQDTFRDNDLSDAEFGLIWESMKSAVYSELQHQHQLWNHKARSCGTEALLSFKQLSVDFVVNEHSQIWLLEFNNHAGSPQWGDLTERLGRDQVSVMADLTGDLLFNLDKHERDVDVKRSVEETLANDAIPRLHNYEPLAINRLF